MLNIEGFFLLGVKIFPGRYNCKINTFFAPFRILKVFLYIF